MIRQGFVSNSSSSSFIVYNPDKAGNEYFDIKDFKKFYTIKGNVATVNLPYITKNSSEDFDWSVIRYNSFEDKVNFVFFQYWGENIKCLKNVFETALLKIIQKGYPNVTSLEVNINEDVVDKKIFFNHGSYVWEEYSYDSFHTIYRDVDSMVEFLMNKTFYVQGSNDNGGDESQQALESKAFVLGEAFKEFDHIKYDDSLSYKLPKELDGKYIYEVGVCKECGSPIYYENTAVDKEGNSLVTEEEIVYEGALYSEIFTRIDREEYLKYLDIDNLTFDKFNAKEHNIEWEGYLYCANEKCNHSKPHALMTEVNLNRYYPYVEWKTPFKLVRRDTKEEIKLLEGEELRERIIKDYAQWGYWLMELNYILEENSLRLCTGEEFELAKQKYPEKKLDEELF